MPIVAPFRGIRFNPQKAGDPNKVVTQPYDKITPEMQERYYQRSEYSFVRLILNREPNPYQASLATLESWLHAGVLVKDPLPAIYPCRQVFTHNGHRRVRRGLTCLCRLEPLEGGRVLPHERTLSKPKEDRLNLMRVTKKQFEQVFMLYADDADRINELLSPIWKWRPDIEVTDEYGTIHSLWTVTDPKTIRSVQLAMRPKTFVIADGHHRYETALNYRDEARRGSGGGGAQQASNYRLVTCVNLADPALVILPTHRLVSGLAELNLAELLGRCRIHFNITKIPVDDIPRRLSTTHAKRARAPHSFLLYAGPDKAYALVLRADAAIDRFLPPERSPDYRGLDVVILHALVIEHLLGVKAEEIENHVRYAREVKDAMSEVEQGRAQLALFVHPTGPEQVRRVAENWERMPQKSTDFFPKLISGMVFLDVADTELIS